MTRGSFSRSVARAAASGGGRAYRARRPIGWYAVMTLICLAGIGLIAYSRNEKLNPTKAATVGPTASDHWKAALSFDICGTVQPVLAASSNLSTVGLRTYGDGLIDIDPGATASASTYEGKKATLGLFVKNYSGLTLTSTSLKLPGTGEKGWANGDKCGKVAGKLQTKVWSSPTATGHLLTTNPANLHLTNGMMITVAFAPSGSTIPEPSPTVVSALSSFLSSSSSTTTTTPTTTTTASSTTTTKPKATATTSKSTSTT